MKCVLQKLAKEAVILDGEPIACTPDRLDGSAVLERSRSNSFTSDLIVREVTFSSLAKYALVNGDSAPINSPRISLSRALSIEKDPPTKILEPRTNLYTQVYSFFVKFVS